MSDELMHDRNQPPPEEGSVTNILRRHDMRKCVVTVKFRPKTKKAPVQIPRVWEFPTAVTAQEFIDRVQPPPGLQLGSPKQALAKKARLLRLQPHLMSQYEIDIVMTIGQQASVGDDVPLGTELTPDTDVDTFVEGAVVDDVLTDFDASNEALQTIDDDETQDDN